MISLIFQALNDYTLSEVEQQAVRELLESLQEKYPRLFADNEVVVDIRFSEDTSKMNTSIDLVTFIPSFDKVVIKTTERTFSQALSDLKKNLDRTFRDLTKQFN